jgi:hypothetical protein
MTSLVDLSALGFPLVFNTSFVSIVYHAEVICVFSMVINGGLLISAAKGRIKPEVTSPFDSSKTVSYNSSICVTCLTCTV